jgi:hypothetical protein
VIVEKVGSGTYTALTALRKYETASVSSAYSFDVFNSAYVLDKLQQARFSSCYPFTGIASTN